MKRHAVQSWDTLGVRFSSEDEKSGSAKLLGSKKRAVLCWSAGVQEAVQILGLKFSSEDEKSGKVTWEQKAHSAVQCSLGGRGRPLRAAPACTGR